jgi:ABC-type sugar transport system permease subunit/ABC-type glycerol-3-phosphate transport system substrate-binding protein
MRHTLRLGGFALGAWMALMLLAPAVARAASDDADLVTPIRIGRADAPLVLSMWAQQEYSHLAARQDMASTFHAIFRDWARDHPDIRVDISAMPALELHKAKLLMAAANRRLPDVASIDSFWVPLFMAGKHIQPLDPYWPAEDRADFLPFTIDTLSDEAGHVYGLWHGTDCRMLYYRKDLVPKPPATWDEVIEIGSRITREKRISGYLFNAGRWEGSVFDHLPMFWGQGGELVDAKGAPIFGLPPHREKMVSVLQFMRDTVVKGASPSSVLAHNDYQQLSAAAIAGDAAMFLGGSWQLRELEPSLSKEQFALWEVAPIPQKDPGVVSTGAGGWIWVSFARDPARQKAAAELIQYIESTKNVGVISRLAHQLPARKSVYDQFPFFAEDPFHQRFGEWLAGAKARPAVLIYPTISEQLQLAIGYAVSGDKTPEQAVDGAWAEVLKIDARQRTGGANTSSGAASFDPLILAPAVLTALLFFGALVAVWRQGRAVVVWLLPAMALATAFLVYPMLELLRLAATNSTTEGASYAYTAASLTSVATDPELPRMIFVTLLFVTASVVLQLAIGLGLAVLIDAARRRGTTGTMFARASVVSAWVIPGVLIGVLWRILLMENRAGIVNYVGSGFGLPALPFLSSGSMALASVVVANVWRGSAFSMILQFAGLMRIPKELHEAADLEGLTRFQRLRWLILPQLKPILALNLVLITISTLNTFDLILPLTGGGPARQTEVIALYMYRSAFYSLEAGRSAAIATVMLAVNLALAFLAVKVMRRQAAS